MKKKAGKYIIHVDGIAFLVNGSSKIKEGDTYIAENNTGKHLLTALEVKDKYIISKEKSQYAYNICDCIKVEKMIG